jgi:hypothetical protein
MCVAFSQLPPCQKYFSFSFIVILLICAQYLLDIKVWLQNERDCIYLFNFYILEGGDPGIVIDRWFRIVGNPIDTLKADPLYPDHPEASMMNDFIYYFYLFIFGFSFSVGLNSFIIEK